MTPEEKEAQRQSFAYGNTHISNPAITREMVAEQAAKLTPAEITAINQLMHERVMGLCWHEWEGAGNGDDERWACPKCPEVSYDYPRPANPDYYNDLNHAMLAQEKWCEEPERRGPFLIFIFCELKIPKRYGSIDYTLLSLSAAARVTAIAELIRRAE